MKSYPVRILVSLLLAAALSYVLYLIVERACVRTYTSFEKTQEFLNSPVDYNCLLLGSSRMEHTVNPRVFDSVLGTRSYNAGAEGANIQEMKMLLEAGLRLHGTPRLVVVSLDHKSLAMEKGFTFYPIYIPFMKVPEVKTALKEQGVSVNLLTVFPFMRLTEMDDYYKGALIKQLKGGNPHEPGRFLFRGYEGVTHDTIDVAKLKAADKIRVPVTNAGKKALQDLIGICRSNRIQLVFIYAPEFNNPLTNEVSNADSVLQYFATVSAGAGVPFLRHDLLPMSREPRYFYNPAHVNIEGADLYSKLLAEELKARNIR